VSLPAKDLRPPILCYVTDRNSIALEGIALEGEAAGSRRAALLQRIATAAAAGVDWIQIREKDLSARDYSSLVREALIEAKTSASAVNLLPQILVNDRLDIALTEQAAGIHLGENSLSVGSVRTWLRSRPPSPATENFLVGVSCHSKENAVSAARDGADYIFFGPLFATPSKAAYGAPQGLERLAEVCNSVPIPVLAIGGITPATVSACLAAGAAGIAAIRLFQDATDLPSLFSRNAS
jgi:thiamine-phosphate pyrophosphorylase